jgi:hypothetical protein
MNRVSRRMNMKKMVLPTAAAFALFAGMSLAMAHGGGGGGGGGGHGGGGHDGGGHGGGASAQGSSFGGGEGGGRGQARSERSAARAESTRVGHEDLKCTWIGCPNYF